MWCFISGMIVGVIGTVFCISLAMAAKSGDELNSGGLDEY